VQNDYLLSNLDCVTVKGKTVGIKVYELVGRKSTATLTETNMCKLHNEAMELYFKRDFEGAHEKLVEVLELISLSYHHEERGTTSSKMRYVPLQFWKFPRVYS